jgi:hypothetical protein
VGQPLPPGALTWFYHPDFDDEFSLDPARFGGNVQQAQAITLLAAQAMLKASPPDPQPEAGLFYAITATSWKGGGPLATVYVHALNASAFAPVGFVLDSQDKYQQVRVDVAAGTLDTEAIRALDIALFGEVDPSTGQVPLLIGPGVTPDATIYEVLVP